MGSKMSKEINLQNDYKITKDNRVACDGGELGHPKIFLSLVPNKEILCPYCSRKFINRKK